MDSFDPNAKPERPHYLFAPGDQQALMDAAADSDAAALELDLEDGVHRDRKAAARKAIHDFLAADRHRGRHVLVRINALESEWWRDDIEATVDVATDYMLPQITDAGQILRYDEALSEAESRKGLEPGSRKLHPVVETAAAVERLESILDCTPRVEGIVFGQADYSLSVGCEAIGERGFEPSAVLEWTNARLIVATAARGMQALIGPWAPHGDRERLVAEMRRLFKLGYDGMVIGSPAAVAAVEEARAPSPAQAAFAEGVVEAAERAEAEGLGYTTHEGWMVESVHFGMARRLLSRRTDQGKQGES